MARRLLGPVNAASVLEAQSEDNMQNAQVNGGGPFSRTTVFWWLCCDLLVPEQGREMGFIWYQCKRGEGRGQLALAELCIVGIWGFFGGVVVEGGNLSTIPLLGLICRNDVSREELQQLLHSTLHPACDRQGAAQPGIQVLTL